jgi:hypothetical protein
MKASDVNRLKEFENEITKKKRCMLMWLRTIRYGLNHSQKRLGNATKKLLV